MFKRIVKGIIFIGFCVQIALGFGWMACNMAGTQDFARVSAGLYGRIVRLFGQAYPALYLLQLLAAGYAGWRLVFRLCGHAGSRIWSQKKKALFALWGSLALMTLPMAMQCHMALLPYSLVCSAGLLQLSFCCDLLEPAGSQRHSRLFQHMDFYERSEVLGHREIFEPAPFAGLLLCYFAQALLLPEYFFLGAVTVAVMLLLKRRGIAGAKMRLKIFLLAAVAAAGILAACLRDGNAGTENDISGVEWTLMKRLCWSTLWIDHEGLPDKLREAAADAIWESTHYPGNMDRIFKPAVEAAMDAGEAKPLLAEAARSSWRVHYPMIIRQIGWDALGYCISPIILQLQLSGDAYESHSSVNYGIMRRRAPVLTRRYIDYSSWWFTAAAVLTALLLAARLAAGERPYGRKEGRLTGLLLVFAACCVCWYTVQGAGIMDYKYTVIINQMWFLWSFRTMADIHV